jgi:hypothetical protein
MTPAPVNPHLKPGRDSIRLPRPLWIGIAAGAMFIVWFGLFFVLPVYRQQKAIAVITAAGGNVYGSYAGPDCIQDLLAEYAVSGMASVESVTFLGAETTGEAIDSIGHLDALQELIISGPAVTDACLIRLRGLRRLRLLFIYDSQITDAGMAELSSFTSLRQLHLSAPDATDAGLKHLEALTNLDDLELLTPNVSSEAIGRLEAALPRAHPTVNDEELFANRSFATMQRKLK